jgi:Icc-related predicted phosphoesterase
MRVLVVSDLHGDLDSAREAVALYRPGALLSCGDWGDPGEVDAPALADLVASLPAATTFGNHDPMDLLGRLRDAAGAPFLLGQGEARTVAGLRVATVGGIWAKSHKKACYVTDDDVAEAAARIARGVPVDVLITHGCPVGLADLTPAGRHGGQRCFLDAFKTVAPRLHLCGHLHVAQERTLKDGRRVLNVGATPAGEVALIETRSGGGFEARLDHFDRPPRR